MGNWCLDVVFCVTLDSHRNFETVLNEASLGNLNRQFVSLLRSEQDAERPIVGVPDTFQKLLGADATLFRMHDGLAATDAFGNPETMKRRYVYFSHCTGK